MRPFTFCAWTLASLFILLLPPAQAVTRFENCSQARDYFVRHALEEVTEYGLGNYYAPLFYNDPFFTLDATLPVTPPNPVAGEDFSTTNVQESGVDEPDYVKTDGRYIYLLRDATLYVVDLSDPARPKLSGELKIPGFSAYLHPLGKDLLLGIGQDADAEGRTLGMQVSLFDVSDPTNPRRLQKITLKGAWSEVEWDHKAFLWWEPRKMLFAPFEKPDYFFPSSFAGTPLPPEGGQQAESGDAGIIVARIANQQIKHVGTLRNATMDKPVAERVANRTVIINDRIYTFSTPYNPNPTIAVHDLNTLQTLDWITFGVDSEKAE